MKAAPPCGAPSFPLPPAPSPQMRLLPGRGQWRRGGMVPRLPLPGPRPTVITSAPARAAVSAESHAGSIIVSLASLPDFLRKPILSRRVGEFFGMPEDEKAEIVSNALAAGPGIPFPNFARLLKTWLEVMASLPAGQRAEMFGRYAAEAARRPDALAAFHIDGILAVFDSLGDGERAAIERDAAEAAAGLDEGMRRRLRLVVPDRAAALLGL